MLRFVEVAGFHTLPGNGGTGSGGEPLLSYKKGDRLGTEAGGIGVHVGYGSDGNLATITEAA